MNRLAYFLNKYGDRMDTGQIADELRISRKSVQNMISAGALPLRTYKIGRIRYVDSADFCKYVERQKKLAG